MTKDASEQFAEGVIRANRTRMLEETQDGVSSSVLVPTVGAQQEGTSSSSSLMRSLLAESSEFHKKARDDRERRSMEVAIVE